jgi:hypothetical protein
MAAVPTARSATASKSRAGSVNPARLKIGAWELKAALARAEPSPDGRRGRSYSRRPGGFDGLLADRLGPLRVVPEAAEVKLDARLAPGHFGVVTRRDVERVSSLDLEGRSVIHVDRHCA